MWLLKKLNNLFKLFLAVFILVSAGVSLADTKWEVAVVFRGAEHDEAFQKDIDDNILELARIQNGPGLKLGIYRESMNGSYIYIPGSGPGKNTLSDLLHRQDLKNIPVPGSLKKFDQENLAAFLKTFYKSKESKKALIIYSHGKGAEGLTGLSPSELKETLSQVPRLDLLWFDACFMASFEFLYEMRKFSDYTLASQEAEFSSGLPFQTLSMLPEYSSAKDAALTLARNFIESYSFLKNGQQRNYVSVSSATISVVENKKLESAASALKKVSVIFKSLNEKTKNDLRNYLEKTAGMDQKDLIDLGRFLIELRKKTQSADAELTSLIRLLNIESVRKLKTNPRIHLTAPEAGAKLVYGFNNWQMGDEDDFGKTELFRTLLRNDGFIAGPVNANWPYKTFQGKEMVVTPFAPSINAFNYYFLSQEGKLLSPAMTAVRTHDVVESPADSSASPLLYSAYTQQMGTKAERYTGLNITMPGSVPSMDYFELEFNQLAQWLSL